MPGACDIAAPSKVEFAPDLSHPERERVQTVLARACPKPGGGTWRTRRLLGGASNANYVIDAGDRAMVLCVAGPHGSRLGSDRRRGNAAHRAAAAAGLAPELLVEVLPEGHTLSAYLDDSRPLTAGDFHANPWFLREAGELLHRLHRLEAEVGEGSIFEVVERLNSVAEADALALPADYADLLHTVRQASEASRASGAVSLCHNDLVCQNFVLEGGRLWLVDWEFAWRGDPAFDLGGLAVNAALDPAGEQALAAACPLGGDPVDDVARVRSMRGVSAFREALWSVVAEQALPNEWDYRAWADKYFEQARREFSADMGVTL